MTDSIIFSIIIPHKNIPGLLQRCIDSIPVRNDIQIIVVDDNSNPEIVDFDNFPGNNNSCVEIYLTKDGKGAGYARNIGLSHAKGKWILFADADDFFTEHAFETFYSYNDDITDIIYFNTLTVDSDTLEILPNRLCGLEKWIRNKDINGLKYRSTVPWGKMINRSFIQNNNITFHELPVANDIWFSCQVGYNAKNIQISSVRAYCSTVRKGSLYNIMTKERREIRFREALNVNNFLYSHKLRKYRVEPLDYYWPKLYKPFDLLSLDLLISYIKQEKGWIFYYIPRYICSKLSKIIPIK